MSTTDIPPSVKSETPAPARSYWQRWAWLPIPLFIAAITILGIVNPGQSHESLYLLAFMNLVFSTFVSLGIAILCARSFSVSGDLSVLMLSCGVLAWGLACGVVSFFIDHSTNIIITIHNLGIFASGILHLAGVALEREQRKVKATDAWLWFTYTGVLAMIAAITLATLMNWTPLFFVQGEGGTPLRQLVLTMGVVMFFVTSAMLWSSNLQAFSHFKYYYSIGLALLAIGLTGDLVQTVPGNPASWAGRTAQYLGGIYMVWAAISSLKTQNIWGTTLGGALQEARQQNDFLAEILGNASQPFAIGYPDGRLGLTNQAFCELTGYTADELQATDWSQTLTPPEWREMEREKLEELHRHDIPVRYEKEYIRKDGSRVPVELLVHLKRNEQGNPEYYYTFLTDTTYRKQSEDLLRTSEELFSTVFRASPVAISISHLADGRFTDVNKAFLDMFGYTYEEVVGKTSLDLCLWLDPDERKELVCMLQKKSSLPPSETRFRRKSGEIGYAQLAVELIDVDGKKLILGLLIDITERKKTEDILHRYQLLADNSRDIILFLQRDGGQIIEANTAACKAYGYSHEELLASTIHDLRATGDTMALTEELMTQADEQGIIFEAIHKRKDGSTFPVEVSSQGSTIGGVRTLISIIRDISDRVLAKAEIQHLASFPQLNPNPVLEINEAGEIIICNNAAATYSRITGFADASPFIPADMAKIFASWDRKTTSCVYREARLTNVIFAETILLSPEFQTARIYATDITDIKQAELALQQSNAQLNLLADSARDLLSDTPLQAVESLCNNVMSFLDCQVFFNFLVDEQSGRLHLNACGGISETERESNLWRDYGQGVCGCVARDGCGIVLENIQETTEPHTELIRSYGIQAYACNPLMAQEKVIGTLAFGSRTKRSFSEDDLALMKAVADQVAIAIERQQFREMLQKSRLDMLTILDNLPFMAWLKDAEGRYIMVNKPFATISGLESPKDAIGKTDFEVWPQDAAELYRNDDRKIMESKQRLAFEGVVHSKGGDRWYETFKAPRLDQSGNVIGTTGISRDISERKQVADALKKAHDELEHRVKERTEDLAVTISALQAEIVERERAEESLKRLNCLFAVMCEIDQVIVRTKDRNTLFQDFCRIAVEHGEFRLCWVGLLDESGQMMMVATYGATDFLDDIRIFTGESPDCLGPTNIAVQEGSYFICNDFLSDPCISHWHEHGKDYGIYAAASVALKDEDRVIGALTLYAGEENLFDRQHEDLIMQMGADISFALDNINRENMRREAEQALQTETLSRLQTLEALQKNERMLMHQSRLAAMGEMINNIAHQWRQPLNVVGLIFQELQICYEMGKFDQDYLDQRVKQAMGLISHMSITIDDFRNFFKPDKDKVKFSVNEVIGKTISLIEDNFKNQGITIDLVSDTDPIIDGYPNEYSQVLLNILMNAKDAFSERDPALPRILTITSLAEGGKATVTIADTAGGIPGEILNKVFEPYFTTKGPDKGTGVGLFMAKTIIEKNLNGTLTVRNTDNGAEFRIEV